MFYGNLIMLQMNFLNETEGLWHTFILNTVNENEINVIQSSGQSTTLTVLTLISKWIRPFV